MNLAALLFSLVLLPLVADSVFGTWALFFVFTVLHLVCNYNAVTVLQLDMFNRRRAAIAIDTWLQSKTLLSPAALATKEPLFIRTW